MAERFDLRARAASFTHASRGVAHLVVGEHNARIHLIASLAVVALAAWLGTDLGGWVDLVLVMALVWAAEAFNTGLESLADAVHAASHPLVGRAKDLSAGGVLIAACAAVVVGLCVLGPPLWERVAG